MREQDAMFQRLQERAAAEEERQQQFYPNWEDMTCSTKCRSRENECSCTDEDFEGIACEGKDCKAVSVGSGCGSCEITLLCYHCAQHLGQCLWCGTPLISPRELQACVEPKLVSRGLLKDLVPLVVEYCVQARAKPKSN